ncbi:MAG: hypothetical protein R3E79_11975 [Caldilineaceae bacterium]
MALKYMPELQDIPAELAAAPFPHAFEIAEEAALSPQERLLYEASLKSARDAYAEIMSARQKGLQKGRQEGRQEEKRATARAMRTLGLSPAMIAQVTGLTPAEIEQLS